MPKAAYYSVRGSQPQTVNIQLIDNLLRMMVDKGASDMHLKVPSPPVLRIDGELVPQEDMPSLTPMDVEVAFEQVTNQVQRTAFRRDRELDFAYSVPGMGRFRVNALQQRGTMSLAFRLVPFGVPSIDKLGLPQVCKELILKPSGLVLVTGPAGSGKSTTLAAMVSHLNDHKRKNIITIEDPIEFLFRDRKCIIRQRDLGEDTESFHSALVHALRHDPDVIVIGEMRDVDTIGTAMMAAETGHLVLGTLHTLDAVQSIARIIDIFPYGQQQQTRLQLSQVIEAVLSQTLLRGNGGGRVAAFEIMVATAVIRRLIREEKIYDIRPNMEMGARDGMQTMDQALARLVKSGRITHEEAVTKSHSPTQLLKWLQQPSNGETQVPIDTVP